MSPLHFFHAAQARIPCGSRQKLIGIRSMTFRPVHHLSAGLCPDENHSSHSCRLSRRTTGQTLLQEDSKPPSTQAAAPPWQRRKHTGIHTMPVRTGRLRICQRSAICSETPSGAVQQERNGLAARCFSMSNKDSSSASRCICSPRRCCRIH